MAYANKKTPAAVIRFAFVLPAGHKTCPSTCPLPPAEPAPRCVAFQEPVKRAENGQFYRCPACLRREEPASLYGAE